MACLRVSPVKDLNRAPHRRSHRDAAACPHRAWPMHPNERTHRPTPCTHQLLPTQQKDDECAQVPRERRRSALRLRSAKARRARRWRTSVRWPLTGGAASEASRRPARKAVHRFAGYLQLVGSIQPLQNKREHGRVQACPRSQPRPSTARQNSRAPQARFALLGSHHSAVIQQASVPWPALQRNPRLRRPKATESRACAATPPSGRSPR